MAALVEGRQYGLSSKLADSNGKTVIYMKLTDSALRSFEDYSSNQQSSANTSISTIQFKGENGVISIPDVSSNGSRTYHFNVSSIQGDPNGSFDCVQQCRRSKQLDLLGSMSSRITVQAGEDVYQATKVKMTLAEEESKKVCAKEIKPSGPNIGRRVKKVIKHANLKLPNNVPSVFGALPTARTENYKTSNILRPENGSVQNKSNHINASQKPPNSIKSQSSHLSQHSSNNNNSSHHRNASQHVPLSNNPPPSQPKSREPTNHKPPVSNSGIINRPYKDRVIHLLAVRPYKKPELLARLQRDGIREKDKNSIGSILQQVAVMNVRDNTFTLSKYMYKEVQLDWAYYTEVDKQLLRRRLPVETNGTPSPPASGVSPLSSLGSQHNSPVQNTQQQQSHKRPFSSDDANKLPASNKKPRVAEKLNPNAIIQDADSTQSRKENQRGGVSPLEMASSTSDTPDYLNQYTVITSQEQRQKYKSVFNTEYEEYRTLHSSVDKVAKQFAEMGDDLNKTKEGTLDYENIKNQILSEYKNIKADPKFVEQKKRFDYLHSKLAHVKRLIVEYDNMSAS